jgi:hypothetical protein
MIRRLWLANLRSKLKSPAAACEASGALQSHQMLCGTARLQQCAESTGDTYFPHTRTYGRRAVKTGRKLGNRGEEPPGVTGWERGVRATIVASHREEAKV